MIFRHALQLATPANQVVEVKTTTTEQEQQPQPTVSVVEQVNIDLIPCVSVAYRSLLFYQEAPVEQTKPVEEAPTAKEEEQVVTTTTEVTEEVQPQVTADASTTKPTTEEQVSFHTSVLLCFRSV